MNTGLKNEIEIVELLNNVKYGELDIHWKQQIKMVFPFVIDEDIIKCCKIKDKVKADIIIQIREKRVNVSIKSGNDISVHSERLDTFIDFLKEIHISERTIKILKFYHYGDLTINGTGTKTIPLEELKIKYKKMFYEANVEINRVNILKKIFERFLFIGNDNAYFVEYMFYGNSLFGFFIERKKIMKYLLENFSMHLVGIHFGNLSFQPASRQIGNPKRKYIQIKWHSFLSDFQKIIKKTNN